MNVVRRVLWKTGAAALVLATLTGWLHPSDHGDDEPSTQPLRPITTATTGR